MGQAETAVHSVAAVETALHASKEPDTAGIDRSKGMEERQKWPRPLVERWGLAHARCFRDILLHKTGAVLFTAAVSPLSAFHVNRRIRNRTYGGVGGRREYPFSYPIAIVSSRKPPGSAGGLPEFDSCGIMQF